AVFFAFALAACTPVPTPMESGTPNRAGLVIVHGSGEVRRACVDFREPSITGEELLGRAGFAVELDEANPMGSLVCSIAGEGCNVPAEPCLCRCLGPGTCAYWAYFQRDPTAGWIYSAQGARTRTVRHGDLDGWVWLASAGPAEAEAAASPLQEFRFENVCPDP
ncbi:MAG: hypothetical protein ACRDG5_08445, partial [Anaerolineales bacterium]